MRKLRPRCKVLALERKPGPLDPESSFLSTASTQRPWRSTCLSHGSPELVTSSGPRNPTGSLYNGPPEGVCLVQGPRHPVMEPGLTSGPPDSQARALLLVKSAYYTSPGTWRCQRRAQRLTAWHCPRSAGRRGPAWGPRLTPLRLHSGSVEPGARFLPAATRHSCGRSAGARLAVDAAIRLAGQHRRAGDTAAADMWLFISSRMREEESGQERVLRESRDRQMDTGTETEEGDSSLYGRVSHRTTFRSPAGTWGAEQ